MQEMQETKNKIYNDLAQIDVSKYIKKKANLTYLSWANAWAQVKKVYPDATYNIVKFNDLPYIYDENTGYMVFTTVTISDLTYEMWLPVMDGANKAMKDAPYTYKVKSYGKEYERTVEAATMFDINKTIMRCLTKNLAMFGLGLYIYAGEDLPEDVEDSETENAGENTVDNVSPVKDIDDKTQYRNEFISFCKEHSLDVNKMAEAYNLTKTSTAADFKKAVDSLTGRTV